MTHRKDHPIDWSLIRKRITGSLNPQEEEVFQQWLNQSPRHQAYYEAARKYLLPTEDAPEAGKEIDTDQALEEFFHRISTRKKRTLRLNVAKYAAIIILLLVSTWMVRDAFLAPQQASEGNHVARQISPGSDKARLLLPGGSIYNLEDSIQSHLLREKDIHVDPAEGKIAYRANQGQKQGQGEFHKLVVPKGGEYRITLPDGTRVWLNAGSSLKYPTFFANNQREVTLDGEGYFEVSENADRPFIVHTQSLDVRATGTSFNLKAYPQEECIATTLLSGKVCVESSSEKSHVHLQPGKQALYDKKNQELSVQQADTEMATAWKNGYFIFRNENLQSILRDISRWYDVKIHYQSNSLKKLHFTGKLKRYSNISSFTELIELTGKVQFTIHEDTLSVKK